MKNGTLVILIGTDGVAPPIGAEGEIVGFDTGDYEVDFPKYPCPNGHETTWFFPPTMLMPITPNQEVIQEDMEAHHD